MRYLLSVIFITTIILTSCGSSGDNLDIKDLKKPATEIDSISYVIGYGLGRQIAMDSIKPNYQYVLYGLQNALKNDTTFLNQAAMDMVMMKFQDKKQKERQMQEEALAAKNKSENPKFLEENKKKPGVKVTPSGLQYEVLKEGTGATPQKDDMVKINLIAKLKDGTEFDNTYNKQPISIPVSGTLPGWTEALQMMKVGSKWRLVLPPELGLGDRGAPPRIPPGAVLVFDLELISIEGKAPERPNMPPPPQPQQGQPPQPVK